MLPLFISDVPLQCINQAAETYHVPAKLIISVLNVERGKAGMAMHNTNGTYDLGPMQINTLHWPALYRYGITPKEVQYNPCINVKVGSWILARSIAEGKNLLEGVGDYHSHTKKLNEFYSANIYLSYKMIREFLK